MEKESTSKRLLQIMHERNLKQTDIISLARPYCEKYNVKLGKSDLSQYVSGKVAPSQDKLVILGMALNVSEAWLMGMDVTKERGVTLTRLDGNKFMSLYLRHKDALNCFAELNKYDQEIVERLIFSLAEKEKTED